MNHRAGIAAVAATLAAALAGSSAAAGPVVGWTPAATENLVTSLRVTFYNVRAASGGFVPADVRSAKCAGVGKAKRGRFSLFSCRLTWPNPNLVGVLDAATMFVRPWSPAAACITSVSAGSCPPPLPTKPRPNDPRACGDPNLAKCVLAAAGTAMQATITSAAIVGTDGEPITRENCAASAAWTSYRCTWDGGSGAVTFALTRAGWSAHASIRQ